MTVGGYRLWLIPADRYVQIGTITRRWAADRTDIGVRSIPFLRSHLAQHGIFPQVDYASQRRFSSTLPSMTSSRIVGTLADERGDPEAGRVAATTHLQQPGAVVLSASFDPGWHASVDGRPQGALMVAPALVATRVPAGTHTVVFQYSGFNGYPGLFALSGAVLVAFAVVDLRKR